MIKSCNDFMERDVVAHMVIF